MSENSIQDLLNPEAVTKIVGTLAPAGPRIAPDKMRQAVESIRAAAEASVDHVHRITGLEAAHNLRDSQVLVTDRSTWAKANAQAGKNKAEKPCRAQHYRVRYRHRSRQYPCVPFNPRAWTVRAVCGTRRVWRCGRASDAGGTKYSGG